MPEPTTTPGGCEPEGAAGAGAASSPEIGEGSERSSIVGAMRTVEDVVLRRQLVDILRELGRRRYGESMRSVGWSIIDVPLIWALPPPDAYTQAQVRVDEHRARIIANGTHVSTELSANDVYCLIEWLGAIYTSGAWPMDRPAWPLQWDDEHVQ